MPSESVRKRQPEKKIRLSSVILLAAGGLLLLALLIWGAVKITHPLTLKSDVYTVQMHDPFDPSGNIASVFLGSKDDVRFEGTVNTDISQPASYDAAYIYNGVRYPFTVRVADTLAPEMKLKDVQTDTTQSVVAEDFIESIADPSGYTLRMDCEDDISQPGTHTVTITAKDGFDNTVSAEAKLERISDTKAPVIENFTESSTLLQGGSYVQKTYEVKDDIDGAPILHVDASSLNPNEPGTYPVIYSVRDRSGNENTYTETVEVQPNPDFGKQICYLTFDDGPSENTQRVLDILRQYGVVGTFFVTAANPDSYPLMKEIVDQGSTIALHTYSHDYASLYSSDEAYFDDLQKISDLVEQQTGVKADVIRFPGGSSNMVSSAYSEGIMSRLVNEVQQRGYQYFDWNVDSTDASGNDVPVEQIVENATAGIGMDDVCILMHDTGAKNTTVDALPQIIQAYKDAGYIFRGLTTQSVPVHHGVNN